MPFTPEQLLLRPWRTGRKVGRTLYGVVGDDSSDDDVLLGMLDSRLHASAVAYAHNAALVQARSAPSASVEVTLPPRRPAAELLGEGWDRLAPELDMLLADLPYTRKVRLLALVVQVGVAVEELRE